MNRANLGDIAASVAASSSTPPAKFVAVAIGASVLTLALFAYMAKGYKPGVDT